VVLREHARAPDAAATVPQDRLLVALLTIFPVIGLEQILHTTPGELLALPFYEAMHWVSDSLLALPLAVAAVWVGLWSATRLRLGFNTASDVFTQACIIALLLALLLVPGQALHDAADRLTHTHALSAVHNHTPVPPGGPTEGPAAVAFQALHALSDGLQGQAIGLPVAFAALLWTRRQVRDKERR